MNAQKSIAHNVEYKKWVIDLRAKLKQAQLKAAVTVNQQLLMFYWELGTDIIGKQKITAWGEGLLKQLSQDLMSEFPDMKGFSERNLRLIRQWVQFWIESSANWQQAVAELTQIPWGHNQVIINKCKSADEGLYYIRNTIEYGWSRSVLTHQIESNLWQREGKALSNFTKALPAPQSDLNVQVNYLRSILPEGAQVGTVDKFQGQEEPIVLVSMVTSSAEDLPRNIEFLYSTSFALL